MPADEDYDKAHEKNKRDSGFRYGCHSCKTSALRPNGYWAPQRRFYPDGRFEIVPEFVEHRMTTSCRNFYLWGKDDGCTDCTQPRDIEYAERMGGKQ